MAPRTSTLVWCAEAHGRGAPALPGARKVPPPPAWCRGAVMAPGGLVVTRLAVVGPRPDVSVVDRLARIALGAGRCGRRLVLSELSPVLGELLELAGLRLEMEGEAERREEALWGEHDEEVAERRDPSLRDLQHLDPPG